ncbi:MAG: hypothetical protein ACO3P1_14120 [Pseudomonadales bacterium]
MNYSVRDEHQRQVLLNDITDKPLPFRVDVRDGHDRSLEQNRLLWRWLTIIGKHQGQTSEEMHREVKLRIGVPILRRDSEAFCETYDRLIRPMSYEEKIAAMDLIDVTSILTVRQMTELLDEVSRQYRSAPIDVPDWVREAG